MLRRPWLRTCLLRLGVALLCWLSPALVHPSTWLGLRTGNDLGAPAVVWERPWTGRLAFSASLGPNMGYSGVHLQIGAKWYEQCALRGFFLHLALSPGVGSTRAAAWASLQVSAGLGHAWPPADRVRAMLELGKAVRAVRVTDAHGRTLYSLSSPTLVHLTVVRQF